MPQADEGKEEEMKGQSLEDAVMQQVDADVINRWRAHRTGLAPYYPLLYSLVIGMGAQRVFEFGSGESSEVLHAAVKQTGGRLISCSPDHEVVNPGESRGHLSCTSDQALAKLGPEDIFDLVLHDGSHSAEVVAADLKGILPRVKQGGLVLIHDTLHSYVGAQMRDGVTRGVALAGVERVRAITFPFAFGLTVFQVEENSRAPGTVSRGRDKPSSPHHTEIV